MATIKITCTLHNVDRDEKTGDVLTKTIAGVPEDGRILNIGTSEEIITINTDIADNGYCYLCNLDDTNYIEVGPATTVYMMEMWLGDIALFPLCKGASQIFAKANTAAVPLQVKIIERE